MSSTSSPASISPSTVLPTPRCQHKDFETAFENLSSLYGLHGTPSPTVEFMSKEPLTPSLLSFAKSIHIVPLGRHNSLSSESTVVPPNAGQKTKRDYEAAFGVLSSTYGIGGHIPALPNRRAKSANMERGRFGGFFRTRKATTKSQPLEDSEFLTTQPSVITQDSYEAAFGHLSSLYGTDVGIPSVPSKRMKLFHAGGKARHPLPLAMASSRLPPNENTAPGKDYNTAFGSLAGSYGLYGCTQVPSMANQGSGY